MTNDFKSLQIETKSKSDKIRNLELELEIHQERELVKRTESRLKASAQSVVYPIDPPHPPKQNGHTMYHDIQSPSQKRGTLKINEVATKQSLPSPSVNNGTTMEWKRHDNLFQSSSLIDGTSMQVNGEESALLDAEIIQENLMLADGNTLEIGSNTLGTSKNDSLSSSNGTIQRLRALAQREISAITDMDSPSEKGSVRSNNSLRSNSNVDRLHQIYMKVSNRNPVS